MYAILPKPFTTKESFTTILVTFTTKTYPDITMFGEIAHTFLKMMGHSTKVPGAILAADVPAALARLKAAVDTESDAQPNEEDEEEPVVSIAHRALPLIELLDAAVKADANVMWK